MIGIGDKRMKPFTKDDIGWVAVLTKPGAEHAADIEIRRKHGLWTFYPFSRVTNHRKQGRTTRVFEESVPVFSRYIFARLGDLDDMYAVNDCVAVTGVVRHPGHEMPIRVPPAVMDHWMTKTDAQGFAGRIDLTARKQFKVGDRVIVDDGSPLAGLIMQVSMDDGKEIKAWLNFLGAIREVTVDPRLVKAA